MVLCKDCKYLEAETGKCLHVSAFIPDYINGNHDQFGAKIQRTWTGKKDCGPEAKFFESTMKDITPVTRLLSWKR